eukprot:scaffold19609_cov39-Prasinocladus_malaysianus.AAC.1
MNEGVWLAIGTRPERLGGQVPGLGQGHQRGAAQPLCGLTTATWCCELLSDSFVAASYQTTGQAVRQGAGTVHGPRERCQGPEHGRSRPVELRCVSFCGKGRKGRAQTSTETQHPCSCRPRTWQRRSRARSWRSSPNYRCRPRTQIIF